MRSRVLGILVVATTALGITADVAAAGTATITGARATNPEWTLGEVADITATLDACQPAEDCRQGVEAAIVGAVSPSWSSDGVCPADLSDPADVYDGVLDVRPIWSSGEQTANGTFSSGYKSFGMNGVSDRQTLCVSSWKLEFGGSYYYFVWDSLGSAPVAAPPDTQPPETTITKGPPKRTEKRTLKFRFESDEAATFECKVDSKPWKACQSPKKVKGLDQGRHVFKVRATDSAGNIDDTPAEDKLKVIV